MYHITMGAEKTLGRLLSGTADAAIRFDDLCQLPTRLGFDKRVRGSDHLFRKRDVEDRREREAVPGQTGPCTDPEAKAWFLN